MARQSKFAVLLFMIVFTFTFSALAVQQSGEIVKCPVSGKQIKKSEAKITFEYEGKTYYFCCADCKEKFIENPEKYLKK